MTLGGGPDPHAGHASGLNLHPFIEAVPWRTARLAMDLLLSDIDNKWRGSGADLGHVQRKQVLHGVRGVLGERAVLEPELDDEQIPLGSDDGEVRTNSDPEPRRLSERLAVGNEREVKLPHGKPVLRQVVVVPVSHRVVL